MACKLLNVHSLCMLVGFRCIFTRVRNRASRLRRSPAAAALCFNNQQLWVPTSDPESNKVELEQDFDQEQSLGGSTPGPTILCERRKRSGCLPIEGECRGEWVLPPRWPLTCRDDQLFTENLVIKAAQTWEPAPRELWKQDTSAYEQWHQSGTHLGFLRLLTDVEQWKASWSWWTSLAPPVSNQQECCFFTNLTLGLLASPHSWDHTGSIPPAPAVPDQLCRRAWTDWGARAGPGSHPLPLAAGANRHWQADVQQEEGKALSFQATTDEMGLFHQ